MRLILLLYRISRTKYEPCRRSQAKIESWRDFDPSYVGFQLAYWNHRSFVQDWGFAGLTVSSQSFWKTAAVSDDRLEPGESIQTFILLDRRLKIAP